MPSVATAVTGRTVHTYRSARDGFDGSATLLAMATGFAGFTTLADGSVVYATTGLAADEGALRLFNLSMPGIRGLVGSRTFHGPDGSFTLAEDSGGDRLLGWSWLNIDDRVGFVVRDSQNPVRVRPTSVVLSSGPGQVRPAWSWRDIRPSRRRTRPGRTQPMLRPAGRRICAPVWREAA